MNTLYHFNFGVYPLSYESLLGNGIVGALLLGVLILVVLLIKRIIIAFLGTIELSYALLCKRPLFVHFYVKTIKLNQDQIKILETQFEFYKTLDVKCKGYFRHRVGVFLKEKTFEAKDDFVLTEEAKVLIAATAIMLTFGFRDYNIRYVKTIVIYPTVYYSRFSKTLNKGEFNPRLKTLVLSWDNFLEGYRIEDDKINLGIHEFAHAIHYNSMKSYDINSILFVDEFNELRRMLAADTPLKKRLVASKFIRSYAFTNDSELLAVILETFIETPKDFKIEFPELYIKVKHMLNFNISGYR